MKEKAESIPFLRLANTKSFRNIEDLGEKIISDVEAFLGGWFRNCLPGEGDRRDRWRDSHAPGDRGCGRSGEAFPSGSAYGTVSDEGAHSPGRG